MTMDNPAVYRRTLDEGVNDIRNSFWMDASGEKVCELLDKEF
jgi:hypothetical protein